MNTSNEERERIRKYHTEWQRKNRAKTQEYQRRYFEKKAAEWAAQRAREQNEIQSLSGGDSQ